ncbi:MAG: protein kinase, partial [Deltaproteobacteria bacterium]
MASPTTLAAYEPGTLVLERYVVETAVTRGPLWDVYTAASTDDGDRPAILRVLRRGESTGAPSDAMVRRAQRLATLSHPGLVPVLAAGVHDGSLVIVSADQPGVPFNGVLVDAPSHRLVARDTARVILEAAEALYFLHTLEPPVVHGALRPGKLVLVGESRRTMIMEWGLAPVVLATALDPATPNAFRAPEHTQTGAPVGPAADQFVLASIAYQCLAGTRAFPSEQLALQTIAGASRPSLANLRTDLSERTDAVLHRAWSVDPAERFPDVVQFARALLPLLATADETGRLTSFSLASLPSTGSNPHAMSPSDRSDTTPTVATAVMSRPSDPEAPATPRPRRRMTAGVGSILVLVGGGAAVALAVREGRPVAAAGVSTPPARSAVNVGHGTPPPETTPVSPTTVAPPDAGTSVPGVPVAAQAAALAPSAAVPAPSPSGGGVVPGARLRAGPATDTIAEISAALQHQIDTCSAGQPRLQRHVFVGAAFEASGELSSVRV